MAFYYIIISGIPLPFVSLHVVNITIISFCSLQYSVLESMATGYDTDGNAEPVYDIGWWAPGGQMYSTIKDLNKVSPYSITHILSYIM